MQPPVVSSDRLLALAEQKIQRGLLNEARAILLQMVNAMPPGWRPAYKEADGRVKIAFWNQNEYQHYLPYFLERGIGREIVRMYPSYSRAWYLLAHISLEQKDLDSALLYINQALKLEPDHPEILCKKAQIRQYGGCAKEAYELYVNAIYSRAWNSPEIQARAMRGAGIVLEELGNLEAASVMFKKSLELEPGNQLAMNELSHIYLHRMELARHNQPSRKKWWKFW